VLALGSAFLVSSVRIEPLSAQDPKAEKKAARQKAKQAEQDRIAPIPTRPDAQADDLRPTVHAKPTPAKEIAQQIDGEIDKKLKESKIAASSKATDAEFLRRVTLDITGIIPTAERAQAFIESKDADKRAKLVRELLADSRYGQRMTDQWIWQMFPTDSDNRAVSRDPLVKWMTDSFNANKPWNQMSYDLLTATGKQEEKGETTYFLANRGVDKITDSVGKLFLGVQIQCAQCHNHPFSEWKQTEYWGLAQFFYKVDAQAPRNAKSETVPTVNEDRPARKGLPVSAKNVPAKFLGGDSPSLDRAKPYRPILAQWITGDTNPFFAKAMANRIWSQFFGRGLVNPIDDIRPENEASHPELFALLSKEFVKSGFDVKHLIECICLSEAYQRSSIPTAENKADERLYSHQSIKVLTGEQLYDSLDLVVGFGANRPAPQPKGRPQGNPRDRFVMFYMGGENAKPTDYEAGIPQVLKLMNNGKINSSPKLIQEVSKVGITPNAIIEKLYLLTVSRFPTPAETQKLVEYVTKQTDTKTAYGDVLWALLNSSEFALNR
jgi:hypothetical protein